MRVWEIARLSGAVAHPDMSAPTTPFDIPDSVIRHVPVVQTVLPNFIDSRYYFCLRIYVFSFSTS